MNKLNNKETDLWDLCGQITSPPVPSKDEVWMRLEQHIDILDQKSPNGNTITKPIWIKWQPRFIYAFLLAFLLIMPTTIRYLNTNTVSSEFGMINRDVILSDGTSIQLNADSKISYGSNYGNGNRNVSLKGEAFFNVTPSNVPFVVSTDPSLTPVSNPSSLARTLNFVPNTVIFAKSVVTIKGTLLGVTLKNASPFRDTFLLPLP